LELWRVEDAGERVVAPEGNIETLLLDSKSLGSVLQLQRNDTDIPVYDRKLKSARFKDMIRGNVGSIFEENHASLTVSRRVRLSRVLWISVRRIAWMHEHLLRIGMRLNVHGYVLLLLSSVLLSV
jgi:hypothetical protein